MYKHLLVPIDDTPLAVAIVEQAVTYAAASGARLNFLHARADIGANGDPCFDSSESFDKLAIRLLNLAAQKADPGVGA